MMIALSMFMEGGGGGGGEHDIYGGVNTAIIRDAQ